MEDSQIEIMHAAAEKVLNNYNETGEPFCLFLSGWSEVSRLGLERQVRILLKRLAGLETVAIYRQGDIKRIKIPEEWPSFSFSDNEWRKKVEELISIADMITLFWTFESKGIDFEAQICSSGNNSLKTVAVVRALPKEIYLSRLFESFPRIVPISEIPPFFSLHPEFGLLIERMREISKLDKKIRSQYVTPVKRLEKFPFPPFSGRFDVPIWIEQE